MITFGLTGGIACGKSTATKTFRECSIPMVDADVVARQVVEPDKEGWALIKQNFGTKHFNTDGTLNRASLANLVFTDKSAMDKLNKIMAPLINTESAFQIQKLHSQGHRIVGYDAALICEMGNADKYRPLIVVSCTEENQIARMMKRNQVTREEAMARIASQMPVHEKVKMATYVINTNGEIEESVLQTKTIVRFLRLRDYVDQVISGDITVTQVPSQYQDDVRSMLHP